jgi:methyl-accepting chemotaxis protein
LRDRPAGSGVIDATGDKENSFGPLLDSLEGLRGISSQIHDIAGNLAGSAQSAFQEAKEVQERVEVMGNTVEASRKETQLLLQESAKIQEVVDFLREIVESTHVLGINASILAARAGQAGKGFGVLSQELRKLADVSAQSLGNITSIVSGLQEKITRVSTRIEESGASILGQKESLLAVAGYLQGTVLGVDVIHSVSGNASSVTMDLLSRVRQVQGSVASLEASCTE